MGFFSKEICVLCGKEVGMTQRSKLGSKEFVCSDCLKGTHEFLRSDYVTLDELKDIIKQVPEREKEFDELSGNAIYTIRCEAGRSISFYTTGTKTGEFAFSTGKTKRFGHKCIFSYYKLGPYDSSTKLHSELAKTFDRNADYATIEEKKSGDNIKEYYVCFPYNDKSIRNVKLELDGVCKQEAQELTKRINDTRRYVIDNYTKDAKDKQELQMKNIYKTASSALKAAIKGEDVKDVLKEGIQRSNDIEEGRIKKKSFFTKLIGK